MVDAATEFKKSGFSESESADLALVAQMYRNIADEEITAGESANFIISQMKAFNLTAADSEHIINAVNNVSNNMAVSSADLATNLGKASAALAVGNNTYEESLAMLTAITEITRNGAKSARGLVSVQSRLNQIVDESSSTGKALTEWYTKHNIAIYDQAGQLRSLYDVMQDVAKIWPTLTTNEKDYYLNQQAGANQTQNLASLLSNFESAEKAYALAINSAGSAMKENEAVAESLAFKQNQLSASFQEVANNLISSDLVGHVLDFANALLQLDNETGNVISRILILTGLGWGGTQLLNVSKIIPTISKQFKNFGAVLGALKGGADGLGAAFASVGKGGSALAGFFSSSLPIMLAVAAAITAIVVAVGAIKDAYEKAHRSIADFDGEIGDVNDKLSTNKARLEEIANMPWNERTAEILEEKQAIEDENEKLEEQIELLKEERLERAKKATGSGFNIQTDKRTARLEHGGAIEYGKTYTGADAYSWATTTLQGYNAALKENGQLTDEQMAQYSLINPQIAEQVEWLQLLESSGETLTDEQRALIAAYNEMSMAMELAVDDGQTLMDSYTAITNAGYLTEAQYKKLISLYPDLANGAERTADGYVVQKDALFALMSAEQQQQLQISGLVNGFIAEQRQTGATKMELLNLVKAQITASNTGLNFSQQIAALQQLAQAAGYAGAQVANAMNAGRILQQAKVLVINGKYKTLEEAQAALMNKAWGGLTASAPSSGWSGSFGGGSYVPKPSGQSAAESARQAQIKALQDEKDQIQDTIDAINKKYDAEIDKLEEVNDELEDEIELQKILEEMAEAKASKKMVYKDGKFQYVEDIDAVAAAQVKLDEYNRKKSLKDAKAAIEERRKIELKGYQDRLAIIEANINALRSGFNAELSAYDSYLDELRRKKQQELEILSQTGGTGGTGGSTGGGGSVIPSGPTPSQIRQNESISAKYPSRSYSTANNSQYSASFTKTLQAWYGTSADGIWGRNSYAAAGNRNIDSAAGLYYAVRNTYGSFSAFKKMGGYALGTLKASGGIHMVGEQGPELRVLNQGDGVIPAKQTQRLWQFATNPAKFLNKIQGGTTNSNTAVNVANITLPNVRNAEEFVAGLKNLAYQRAYARA